MLNQSILGVALLVLFSNQMAGQGLLTHAITAADPPSAEGEQSSGGTQAPPAVAPAPAEEERPSWGVIDATGSGVVVHRSDKAELAIGAYALVRYINQLPAKQQFTDHLGNVHDIDTRNTFSFTARWFTCAAGCCRRRPAIRSRCGP